MTNGELRGVVVSVLASYARDLGSNPGSGTLFVSRSGEVDNSPGQGVFPVKGSLGGEPGGPYNLLITGVNPTFIIITRLGALCWLDMGVLLMW